MQKTEPLPIPLLGEAWDKDFVLYTTGTTGQSKGVIISQRAVLANTENLIAGQLFSHDLVFIIAGSMTHLGCWSKIFPTLMQGGTLYILKEGMKNIDAFFQALDMPLDRYNLPAGTKFATFLVPANIRILMQFSGELLKDYADRIDFIETGAAPMAHGDMLKLCQLLPHSRLYNTYASTETGICTTYNYNDGRCTAGCLGLPLKNSQVFITDEGKIACKGKTLMSGYENAEALTATVLHDNTLFTNDNGFIDEEGMLHILGRDDDVINVGGYKISPAEVEDIAMSFPSVKDCILIAKEHKILGNATCLLVQLDEGEMLDKKALARHINEHLERYKVPMLYEAVEEIKRNQNGKLDRNFYRKNK
ncbi:MAG: long-chain fatty acid--CoA ligase [Prevotella sp.]|nr:long-chain fatty acid--CoA ligase [Candidatus Prevotella equi]